MNIFLITLFGLFLACGSIFAEPSATEPSDGQTTTDTSQIKLKERPLPARSNECEFCHTRKSRTFNKKGASLEKMHVKITPQHGKRIMSCHGCHDINNRNYLRSTKENPASFMNSSPVCASCHMEKFRDWSKGLHGKRLGGWYRPQIQFNCIDCHDPHAVTYPSTESVAVPWQSPYVIPKTEDAKGEH